jgi:hypothetical protein
MSEIFSEVSNHAVHRNVASDNFHSQQEHWTRRQVRGAEGNTTVDRERGTLNDCHPYRPCDIFAWHQYS